MKKAYMMSNDFNRIIRATELFITEVDHSPLSRYIRLDFCKDTSIVTAISVDGYRMSVEHSVIDSCSEDFSVYVRKSIRFPKNQTVEISLQGNEAVLRSAGFMVGYNQPVINKFDHENAIPKTDPSFKIQFNGNYLLSVIRAAKESCGGSFKDPIILEFRGNNQPMIIRTNKDDIKVVMPMRLKE